MTMPDARAKARERIERHTSVEARGYGGRRTGFAVDAAEHARKLEIERHLFELARRAVLKDRSDSPQNGRTNEAGADA